MKTKREQDCNETLLQLAKKGSNKSFGNSAHTIGFFQIFNDLTLNIFTFLDLRGLVRSSLVCKNWSEVSRDTSLWREIFNNTDLSFVKTRNSIFGIARKYRDISLIFGSSGWFYPAIEACVISANHDPIAGAYGFYDLCKKACDMNFFDIASKCQKLAKQHDGDVGNEAMSYYIKSRTENSDFMEVYKHLAEMSQHLIDDDLQHGLQSLIEVAKKLADLNKFDEAMQYTQLAGTMRGSKTVYRGRALDSNCLPFACMGRHMLGLKQYKLAEECAQKIEENFYPASWLYSEIIVKQIQEDNVINDRLFSELKPGSAPFIDATAGLTFGLIAHGRYEEAKDFARLRMKVDWDFGKNTFEQKITKVLGVSLDDWFARIESTTDYHGPVF